MKTFEEVVKQAMTCKIFSDCVLNVVYPFCKEYKWDILEEYCRFKEFICQAPEHYIGSDRYDVGLNSYLNFANTKLTLLGK